jgi:hypothetical protein
MRTSHDRSLLSVALKLIEQHSLRRIPCSEPATRSKLSHATHNDSGRRNAERLHLRHVRGDRRCGGQRIRGRLA